MKTNDFISCLCWVLLVHIGWLLASFYIFALDEQPYWPDKWLLKHQINSTVSYEEMITPASCAKNLITFASGWGNIASK